MWVFCCGAKRSGSTLQYNIAARIVEMSGTGVRIEHHKPSEFPTVLQMYEDDPRIKVFKSHQLTEPIKDHILNGNAKALYCYRDVRDVMVSYIKQKWATRSEESLTSASEGYLAEYHRWMGIEEHLLIRKYEEFYDNIQREAFIIAEFLGISIDGDTAQQIARELSGDSLRSYLKSESFAAVNLDKFKFDKKTLLHENHIQGLQPNQFLHELSPSEILLIEKVASHWLAYNDYQVYWPSSTEFLSFSQHGDDYLAWQLLGRKKSGFVVEVGAFDGVHLSNSYSLELKGWRALCVEPSPGIFRFLQANRRKSVNVNCAVVGDPSVEEVDFFVERIGVLSGIKFDEKDVKGRYDRRGLRYTSPDRVKVVAKTLNRIFDEHQVALDSVDFLSIDVEGYELEVLRGFDLAKFRPKLVVIEANTGRQKEDIITFFANLENVYLYVGSNYQNLFFQSKASFNQHALNSLDVVNYVAAKQHHPAGKEFAIQSRQPHFIPNSSLTKRRNFFSFFFRR